MRILLTGATGYIGKRLLPLLLDQGHEVFCCVRDRRRFLPPDPGKGKITVVEADFLEAESLQALPDRLDAAYYLIHSMASPEGNFQDREALSARNFAQRMAGTGLKQVIYLGGIVNAPQLSEHLASRQQVGEILASGTYALTTLRAGIIIGSGSASFEIMRDLVEKLPVMIAPRWLNTRSQPIGVRNVLEFLTGVLDREDTFDQVFDIAGPDILTYREMLLGFARCRGLRRHIWIVPVMTPRLSSYWLYFVTATSYPLAVHLVNSMKVEVVARPNDLATRLGIRLQRFEEAVMAAFRRIEQNEIISSWKDALVAGLLEHPIGHYIQVPVHGCFQDARQRAVSDQQVTLDRLWSIGGRNGWYYANWLWKWRGYLDKLTGGAGLRRGRTHPTALHAGDVLDFWRVLLADRAAGRLLLYAEMKLPGEAWLEYRLDQGVLYQTATFRPRGVWGRLYWYAVTPFHWFVFRGLLNRLAA